VKGRLNQGLSFGSPGIEDREGFAGITLPARFLSSLSLACVARMSIVSLITPSLTLSYFGRVALVLGFTIPRVPSIALNSANPLVNATGPFATAVPVIFSRSPTNFSFPAFASLQFDTSSSFLPVQFTQLTASVYDLDSNFKVASGSFARGSLPAQSFPAILLPLNFTYITSNTSDQTCQYASTMIF
jgi:hypothetical protein